MGNLASSLKSTETEDWIDVNVVRPAGYLLARGFARIGVHPNAVTILSIIIGICSAFFFWHGSWYYEGAEGLLLNTVGALLLFLCYVLDCTDGQLARLTGKSSRFGRMLDGVAAFFFYPPIYILICCRICSFHSLEFSWLGIQSSPAVEAAFAVIVVAALLFSGFVCFAWQMRMADYYIQAHLFFQHGSNSELEEASELRKTYDSVSAKDQFLWKLCLKLYLDYTVSQERSTPQFQRFKVLARNLYGALENIPDALRSRYRDFSRSLMKRNVLLSSNLRTIMLVLFCLVDIPLGYFIFEMTVLSFLCFGIIRRHENFCRQLSDELQKSVDNA